MLKDMKKLFLFFICLISILPAICQMTIVMEKKGDIYYVPGEINGVPLKFIFDTGASNVYLSLTEALFMLKNGYLSEKDFGNTSYSQIANGDIVENTEVLLKEVKVGPIVLNNVKAMVSNTISAPLLLGQSAIQKLGPIQLDGNKLIISSGEELPSNEKAYKLYQQAYQYSEAGKYEDAIKLSYEALKLSNDTNLRAYLYDNIAYAYKNLGDTKKAIDIMNQALGEDLMAEQPGFNLGVYLFDDGKYFEALNAFNNYIMRHPNTTMVHYLADAYAYKGDCHIKLGQIKEGENAYKLSISTQAGSQAYLGLADLYLESNKFLDAAYNYTLALEFEPNRLSNIKRWHQLGYRYAKLGKNDKAFDAFENCKKAFEANNNLIVAAIKSGKKELSLEAIAFSH